MCVGAYVCTSIIVCVRMGLCRLPWLLAYLACICALGVCVHTWGRVHVGKCVSVAMP